MVDNPQALAKELHTKDVMKSAWIPQTMGDQIWFWLEFKDQDTKNNYLNWLNNDCTLHSRDIDKKKTYPRDMLMHKKYVTNELWTQEEVDHWTR